MIDILTLRCYSVFIYGGSTPIGCILTQLIKLWGGHVTVTCREQAVPVMKTLGADNIIVINEEDFEQYLQSGYLRDRYGNPIQ